MSRLCSDTSRSRNHRILPKKSTLSQDHLEGERFIFHVELEKIPLELCGLSSTLRDDRE